jgi:dTDP-4-dehydrorhamnose 3,5-epimerase-like enzyme
MDKQLARFVKPDERFDSRGGLSLLEMGSTLPFEVRRAYWIYGTATGVARGFHAHRRLNQICLCMAGSVRIVLFDGRREESFQLLPGMGGLVLPPWLWHEMHDFSPDCVLSVLADDEYNESDYVRSRENFITHVHSSEF